MNKLFDNPKYPSLMYIAIIVTCLLILFSFTSIIDSAGKKENTTNTKLTGFAVDNNQIITKNETTQKEYERNISELKAKKAKNTFMFIIICQIVLILNAAIVFYMLKRDRKKLEQL